jgi:predicted ATPase/class 3 adenylate cyclase
MADGQSPYRMHAKPDDAPIQGERRVVTVLIADLDDYQAALMGRDPEEAGRLLGVALQTLIAAVHRYGGAVQRSAGDRLLARFGAPVAHEDDPERAIRAAWEMVDVAGRLTGAAGGLADLSVRVGIDTGLVVAGQAAHLPRGDYTVTGEAVSRAGRLSDLAGPGEILVSSEVAASAAAAFEFAVGGAPGHFLVKEPRRGPSAFSGPFVGRQGERLRVHGGLLCAREGRPQWIAIVADAGLGKSRLSRTAIQTWTAALHGQLLWAAASALDRKPLCFVAALLGDNVLSTCLKSVEALMPEHRQAALFQALTDALILAAQSKPALVVIEDLQWIDETSRKWLGHLASALAGRTDVPLAIVCEARPEAEPLLKGLGDGLDFTRVFLGPFGQADATALVAGLLGEERLTGKAAEMAARLVGKAEGNPFFLEEMVRSLETRGVLVRGDEGLALTGEVPEELPESLMSLVASRLDDLPPPARRLAQIAAIVGRTFDAGILARVAGPVGQSEALEALVTARIILPDADGRSFSFAQQITWEAAYNGLLIRARRDLHRQVADALQNAAPAGDPLRSSGPLPGPEEAMPTASEEAVNVDSDPAIVAYHLGQAGEADRAAQAYYAAGRADVRAFAPEDARRHFLAGLDWLGHSEQPDEALRDGILLDLARVEISLGNYDAALGRLDERSPGERQSAEACEAKGDALERKGDFPGALSAFLEGAEAAKDKSTRALAVAKLASIHLRMGTLQEAIAMAADALSELEGLDRPAEEAFVHSVMGMCHHRMGDSEQAIREHQKALALRERARDLAGVAKSLNNLGIAANVSGKWPEAHQHYSRALALFRKLGDRGYVAMALNNLGNLLLLQGEPDLAERHFREALRITRQLGDTVGMATALGNLGETYLVKGAPAEALSYIDSSLSLAAQMVHHEYEYEVHTARGRALAGVGDELAARHELDVARNLARVAGNQAYEGVIDLVMADLCLAAGDHAGALTLVRQSESRLRESHLQLELGRTLLMLARLLPSEEAPAPRDEACAIFSRLGARRDLDIALADGARLEVKA